MLNYYLSITMVIRKGLLFIFTLMLLSGAVSAQEKVYFPKPHYLYCKDAKQLEVETALLKFSNSINNYEIILPTGIDTLYDASSVQIIRGFARNYLADAYLLTNITCLGNSYVLSFELRNVKDTSLIWDDLLYLTDPAMLDELLLLVAIHLGTDTKASDVEKIYRFSPLYEGENIRYRSTMGFGVSFSGGRFITEVPDNPFSNGFMVSAMYDNRDLLYDIRGSFLFGELDSYQLELAAWYPFWQRSSSFYAGLGVGYGGLNLMERITFNQHGVIYEEDFFHNGNGLHTFGGLGWLFNRYGFVQYRLNIEYFTSFYKVDAITNPNGIRLNFGIYLNR